jgi:hemoglobin/transferrin/lactoferrin receptor protein
MGTKCFTKRKNPITPKPVGYFIFFSANAQETSVLNQETSVPLPNLAIYNPGKTKSTLTNLDRKANISRFPSDEILIFKRISRQELWILKSDIVSNTLYLQSVENQLQEVVLSVSKFAQKKEDLPRQIVSITSEEIKFSNSQGLLIFWKAPD